MRSRLMPALLLLLTLLLLSPHRPLAATYSVASNGSDASAGSTTQPFRTLAHGLQALQPGDTLVLHGGTYTGITSNTPSIPSGTSWDHATTLTAAPGETVVFDSLGMHLTTQYVILDRLVIDAAGKPTAVFIEGHHIRFQNSEVKNATEFGVIDSEKSQGFNEYRNLQVHHNGTNGHFHHGIYLTASHNLVEDCAIYANAAYGVHIFNNTGVSFPSYNIVRKNRIYQNGRGAGADGFGILLSGGDGNVAVNNLVVDNAAGISVGFRATNTQVYHNTIVNNPRAGYAGITIEASTGTIVRNNIVAGPNTISDRGSQTTLSHNLTTEPGCVNAAAGDCHLQAGSPAIDAAMPLADVTQDIDGGQRPVGAGPDIGAYEAGAGAGSTLPAPTNLRVIAGP